MNLEQAKKMLAKQVYVVQSHDQDMATKPGAVCNHVSAAAANLTIETPLEEPKCSRTGLKLGSLAFAL